MIKLHLPKENFIRDHGNEIWINADYIVAIFISESSDDHGHTCIPLLAMKGKAITVEESPEEIVRLIEQERFVNSLR